LHCSYGVYRDKLWFIGKASRASCDALLEEKASVANIFRSGTCTGAESMVVWLL
jgi:hypothetical protein